MKFNSNYFEPIMTGRRRYASIDARIKVDVTLYYIMTKNEARNKLFVSLFIHSFSYNVLSSVLAGLVVNT